MMEKRKVKAEQCGGIMLIIVLVKNKNFGESGDSSSQM